jgi:tRNA pseudouridine38-40 synthase
MRYRLLIEYEGTRYHGWQVQLNAQTVQGEIEKALTTVLRHGVSVIGAGRTDTGVHARGQVAHFDFPGELDMVQLFRSLNGILARDIRIRKADPVEDDFHARFSATAREYRYTISAEPLALERGFVWQYFFPLDFTAMDEAARFLIGEHEFTSFCRATAEVDHHYCTLELLERNQEGDLQVYTLRANRFLHGMVRAIMGTLVDVGRGKLNPADVERILHARNRSAASQAAPAKGLILEKVYY